MSIMLPKNAYKEHIMPNRKVAKAISASNDVNEKLKAKQGQPWTEIKPLMMDLTMQVERYYPVVKEDYETAVLADMWAKHLDAQLTWAKYRPGIPEDRIWSNITRSHIDHSRSLLLKEIDHLRKKSRWAEIRILLGEFLKREHKKENIKHGIITKAILESGQNHRKGDTAKIAETMLMDEDSLLPSTARHEKQNNGLEI